MFAGKRNSDGLPEWTDVKMADVTELTEPETDMIWIVAGTMRQASLFARKHGIYPPKWRMVSEATQLAGVSGNVVYVGSYYERRDLMDIKEVVSIGIETGKLKVIEMDE